MVQHMTATAMPTQSTYRHEALLWRGMEEFLAGTVPFVADGVDAGEPVMVAVVPSRLTALRDVLGPRARGVRFVDMRQLGHNPARIMPAWQRFLDDHVGRPVRGIGEPIWSGRRPAEVDECQFHELLLNSAVPADRPFRLRCPYDVDGLPEAVIEHARRSHPLLARGASGLRADPHYRGHGHDNQAKDRNGGQPR